MQLTASIIDTAIWHNGIDIEIEEFHTYYVSDLGVQDHNNSNIPGLMTWEEAVISPGDARRIQNAANRTKQRIIVVGSRAAGTSRLTSDWDYILTGNSRQRHSVKSSLPRGTAEGEINSVGRETGIDIFRPPVTPNFPHVIFDPE